MLVGVSLFISPLETTLWNTVAVGTLRSSMSMIHAFFFPVSSYICGGMLYETVQSPSHRKYIYIGKSTCPSRLLCLTVVTTAYMSVAMVLSRKRYGVVFAADVVTDQVYVSWSMSLHMPFQVLFIIEARIA